MIRLINKSKHKKADDKLHQSLIEAMKLDDIRLEEELKDIPLHHFSEEFEKNMEELLKNAGGNLMRKEKDKK